MSLLAIQQHEFADVFEGATMITIQCRYEGYINLAKRWTSERDKRRNLKMRNLTLYHQGQGSR